MSAALLAKDTSEMNEIKTINPNQAVSQPAGAGTLLDVIARAATDPSFDLDRLERLFAMARQVKADEAKQAFQEAMAAAQAEMPSVVKNKENLHLKSRYAELEAIDDAIRPVYTRHGFSLIFSQRNTQAKGEIVIACTVLHKAGHQVTEELPGIIDNGPGRSANQAIGSSITYLKRYLTCMIFNVVVRGQDKDGNASPRDERGITESQAAEIHTLIDETSTDISAFCTHYQIEKLSDLPRAEYVSARARLLQKKGRANA